MSNPETSSHRNRWSLEEEKQLIESLKNGKTIDVIAKEHKRTLDGIHYRMMNIAVRMMEHDNKSFEDACTIMHLSQEQIEHIQKKHAPKKNTVKKNATEIDVLTEILQVLLRVEAKLVK